MQKPKQNDSPGGQAQTPFAQSWPPPQGRLQPPQFAMSVEVLTHAPLHSVCPDGH
jgi:hypothetical protein